MTQYAKDRTLANYLSYDNTVIEKIPIHNIEIAKGVISSYQVHNIEAYMGETVQYILQKNSMTQIGQLMTLARQNGLRPSMVYWEYLDGVRTASIIITTAAAPSLEGIFGMEGTGLMKIPTESIISLGLMTEDQWNMVLDISMDSEKKFTWESVNWGSSTMFMNFYNLRDPVTDNNMMIGYGLYDTIIDYDESCPMTETLPCSEAVMEALISLVTRDGCYYDDQAFLILGSQSLLRPSGGMGLVVWETDGPIVFNSMDPLISGLAIDEWATEWSFDASDIEGVFTSQSKFSDHRRKAPVHTQIKLSKDGPKQTVAALSDTIMLEKTQLTALSFHIIKPVDEYVDDRAKLLTGEVQAVNSDDLILDVDPKFLPDACPAVFNHDCVYDYGEYLIAKVYEGFVSTYFKGNNGTAFDTTSNIFSNYVMQSSLSGVLKDMVLPSGVPLVDHSVYILSDTWQILASIDDPLEKSLVFDYYGEPRSSLYPVGANLIDDVLTKFGKVIKFGDIYEPINGIAADVFFTNVMAYGSLSDSKDRWVDMTVALLNLQNIEVKYYVKTLQLNGETYYIMLDVGDILSNTKCSEGCPTHSHCAPDGMFCICDEDSVWPDKTIFECKPKYILEGPPTVRAYFYGTFAFCFIGTVLISLLLFIKRKTRLMRLSSHTITQIVVLGVLMLYLGALSFALPPVDYPSVCWQRPLWTIGGASIALLALFLKTWRIQRLFNNSKMKRMKLDNSVLVRYMLIVMVPIVIFLILWIGVMYPDFGYYSPDELEYENPQYGICTERNELAAVVGIYLVCIIIWGGYNAQKSQNVPTGANESGAILKTLLLFFMSGAIFVPLNYMVDDSNQSLMLVIRAFGALVCGGSVLIAIVGQKTIWLLSGHGNSDFITEMQNTGTMGGYQTTALNNHRYRRTSDNNTYGDLKTSALGGSSHSSTCAKKTRTNTGQAFDTSTLNASISFHMNSSYAATNTNQSTGGGGAIMSGNVIRSTSRMTSGVIVKAKSSSINPAAGGGSGGNKKQLGKEFHSTSKKGWDNAFDSDIEDSALVLPNKNRSKSKNSHPPNNGTIALLDSTIHTTPIRDIRSSTGSQH
eukprot:TRINITY_DN1602_c0_g2_i3.p1 TRINITY_DN1602_c0_g2~~TRINITY_DN1602_c0_g2_i3.p1  ORF type:complete len:1086 (+),score=311.48 TRINITY_DN1602_c0_g2_i3:406-3663(+)